MQDIRWLDYLWSNNLANCKAFCNEKISFCSILGLIYYLSKDEFEQFLCEVSSVLPINSSIAFDYPNEFYFEKQEKHSKLANAANETMKSSYSYCEMEALLKKHHFLITEHMNSEGMTMQYFTDYNKANPEHQMEAQKMWIIVCVWSKDYLHINLIQASKKYY